MPPACVTRTEFARWSADHDTGSTQAESSSRIRNFPGYGFGGTTFMFTSPGVEGAVRARQGKRVMR